MSVERVGRGDGRGDGRDGDGRDADPARLRAHVERLEGERNPIGSREVLDEAFRYCEAALRDCGLDPRRVPFEFQDASWHNVVATVEGTEPDAPRVLVGAHLDTVRGTPGADDNASGVAGVLEVGRILTAGDWTPRATVELVIFDLEERQGLTYRVGSRRWAAAASEMGVRYAGALIFEMIGYRTHAEESQRVPVPIRWMDIPRTGDFLACVGDSDSAELVRTFAESARDAAPDLEVVTLTVPMRGWLVPHVRRSDNASFWSEGYPALMLTDTADLRNPHYHRRSDRSGTLDYQFTADVVRATVEAVRRLAA